MMSEKEEEKKGLVGGFKDVFNEYKKIIWPKRDELIKQTISVIAFSFVIGVVVLVYDVFYQFIFSFITRM